MGENNNKTLLNMNMTYLELKKQEKNSTDLNQATGDIPQHSQ